jgi:uncharacterized protein (UPF0333 family)
MDSRGQAAIETMIILVVSILILMVVMNSSQESLSRTGSEMDKVQMSSGLRRVADAADFVYAQSIGASTEVYITVPASIVTINVTESHCLQYVISLPNGMISEPPPPCSVAKLNGSISSEPGSRFVKLTNQGDLVFVE